MSSVRGGRVGMLGREEGRAADHDLVTVDQCFDAATRAGGECSGGRYGDVAFSRRVDDRAGQGMFGPGLDSGRHGQHDLGVVAGDDLLVDEAGMALGQGPGLVDHQGVDLLQSFECFGVLDQDAIAGSATNPDHDGHGCGKAKRARAGDDEHGHCSNDRER